MCDSERSEWQTGWHHELEPPSFRVPRASIWVPTPERPQWCPQVRAVEARLVQCHCHRGFELVLVTKVTLREAQPQPSVGAWSPQAWQELLHGHPSWDQPLEGDLSPWGSPRASAREEGLKSPTGNCAIPDLGEKIPLIQGNPALSASPLHNQGWVHLSGVFLCSICLSLCSLKAVFAQEAAPEPFAQGQECQKHSQELRSHWDKGNRVMVLGSHALGSLKDGQVPPQESPELLGKRDTEPALCHTDCASGTAHPSLLSFFEAFCGIDLH